MSNFAKLSDFTGGLSWSDWANCILTSVPTIKIEDFFRGRVKNKELFGREAIIFMKFIKGRPIFIKG